MLLLAIFRQSLRKKLDSPLVMSTCRSSICAYAYQLGIHDLYRDILSLSADGHEDS